MIYLLELIGINGIMLGWANSFAETDRTAKYAVTIIAFAVIVIAGYLLGSLNSAVIVSRARYKQDIRTFGSGNAGLTNMYRVYGKGGAGLTLLGDVIKQFVSVTFGIILAGQYGAYVAGLFCIIGHMFPVYYGFKGGKGVLTAATMILMIDPLVFVAVFLIFLVVVLLSRYVSLGSVVAAFSYPAVLYYRSGGQPDMFAMIFAVFIGLIVIFMHRSNIFRIFNNEESKFSFKKRPDIQKVFDAEDHENDAENEYVPELRKKKDGKKKKK